MSKVCPHHDELLEELWETDPFVEIQNQTSELMKLLTENTGVEVTSLKNVASIYSNWRLKELLLNFTPPDWAREIYPDQMYEWSTFYNSLDCYNEELARFKAGLILNEIVQIFVSASVGHQKKKQHRKISVYSGHKSTIANILKSLELYDPHIPLYGSALLFELQHWNGNYFVSLFYKNSTVEAAELTVGNCTFECPFPNFQRIVEPIRMLPEDWDGECELRILGIIPTHMNHDVMVACGTLVLLLVILGLFGIWFACRGDKDSLDTSDSDSYLKQL